MGSDATGSAAWAEVKAGVYAATLVSYESLGMQSYQGGPERERMRFRFELEGETDKETGEPVGLFVYANLVLTPKSNLAQIITDMGVDWTPGQAFDLDTLVGRRCQVVVKRVDGPNGERPQITGLLPAQGGRAAVKSDDVPFDKDTCDVKGCGAEVTHYTNGGTPLCAKHTGEDL